MRSTRPYRHGNLPAALLDAARKILDENGSQAVGLRETARRVGVSATAAYRHFTSKDDLLASVAAEGFRELAAAMQDATRGPNLSRERALPISSSPTKIRASFGSCSGLSSPSAANIRRSTRRP